MKIRTTIKHSSLYKEYIVRLHVDGIHIKESDYYTNDKQDAFQTAEAMEYEYIFKHNIQGEVCYSVKKLKTVPAAAFTSALRLLCRDRQRSILEKYNLPDLLVGEIRVMQDGSILYEQIVTEFILKKQPR